MAAAVESTFQTCVRWTGTYTPGPSAPRSYTRDMLVEPSGKPPIPGSAGSNFQGDDSRYNPEDLMLASLAECHLLTYLAFTAKAGILLTSLTVQASGVLASAAGKVRFREAALSPNTVVASPGDVERALALHDTAHEYCFMSNSVNFPIAIRATVSVG